MRKTSDPVALQRQHRMIGLFSVLLCWKRGWDGLAFQRHHMARLLGVKRFEKSRVETLKRDLEPYFEHREIYWRAGQTNSFGSLIVCRRPFKEYLPTGRMSTDHRIANVAEGGPKIGIFCMWPFRELVGSDDPCHEVFKRFMPFFDTRWDFDERFLTTFLALLAQGQVTPNECPRLYENPLDELKQTV